QISGALGLSVDPLSHIVVCGAFAGAVDFGNNVNASALGNSDAFVAKLDKQGTGIWVKTSGAPSSAELAAGCALDKNGHIGVSGFYTGTLAFTPTPFTAT